MALKFLNNRVSFIGVGVPGFSTEGDQVLRVDGGVGVDTTALRAQVDVPEISIRGDIYDSVEATGGIGFFLTQDVNGVRWTEVSPFTRNSIFIFNDGVQVGLSSFTGINFQTPGNEGVLFAIEDPLNPNVAQLQYDVRFQKIRRPNENNTGEVVALATGFGPDGSFWSLPGYGTPDVVGLTSIGIGTNDPRADLQVGIGSTGVEIYAPDGRVKCEILQARRADIDDNLNVRSLNVSPGVTTLTDLVVNGIGTAFSDFRFNGITSTTDLIVGPGTDGRRGELTVAGVASVGLGTTSNEEEIPALFVSGVTTFSGLVTTTYDLYVGGDLFVAGEFFRENINGIFLNITGVGTINQLEANVGIITFLSQPDNVGIATLGRLNFTTGFGTALTNEQLAVTGFATIGDLRVDRSFIVGVATITLADIERAEIGVATITATTSEQLNVSGISTLGFTTINPDNSDLSNALFVVGVSTFTGIASFYDDVAVDGVLRAPTIDVDNIDTEFLSVSGIATINELQFTTGIGSTNGSLSVNDLNFNVGVGTSLQVDRLNFNVGVGTSLQVEFIDIESGVADELDIDNLTFNVGIGTSLFVERIDGTQLSIGVGTPGTPTVYTGVSTLGFATVGLGTTSTEELIPALFVSGVSTFRGLVTTTYDLFVGRNLSVAGRSDLGELDLRNLNVTGIATINDLRYNVGFGTTTNLEFAFVDQLDVNNGIATDFTVREDLETEDLQVNDLAQIERLQVTTSTQTDTLTANQGTITALRSTDADIDTARINSGILTNTNTEDLQVTDRASILNADITNLAVSGVGTVNDLRFPRALGDRLNLNVGVITESTTDTANINLGFATTFNADRLNFNVGVGTTLNLNGLEFNAGFGTDLNVSGFTTLGIGTTQASLFVTGISTFSGGSSGVGPEGIGTVVFIEGDLFVDGDVDVLGNINVPGLDIEQINVGVITITKRLDATDAGISSFSQVDIIDGLNVRTSGVTTLGLSTFFGDGSAYIFGNVNVVGLATTSTGPTAGVAVTLAGQGGITTTGGDLYIGGDLFIGDDLVLDEFRARKGTITERLDVDTIYFNVGFGTTLTVGLNTLTGDRDGDLRVGFGSFGNHTGLGTTSEALFVTGISTFSGFTTFFGDVIIDGKLTVNDELVFNTLTVDDLIVNEDATISGILSAATGIITDLSAEDGKFGVVSIGTGLFNGGQAFPPVGVTSTDAALLSVGISTFIGVGSFIGTDGPVSGFVFIDGNLEVTGDFVIPAIDVDFGRIGLLTAGQIGVNTLNFNVGVGTSLQVDRLNFNVGVGTTLTVENLFLDELTFNVGVGTSLQVERLGVSSSLNVTGNPTGIAVTLAGNGGITTTGGDLYVGEDLFIENDLNFGIGIGSTLTVVDLIFNSGIGTDLNIGNELRYAIGFGTTSNIEFGKVAIGTIDTAGLGTVTITESLNVNALSTFQQNVQIDTNLNVNGNVSIGNTLNYNIGIGTTLSLENAIVGTASFGNLIVSTNNSSPYTGTGVGTITNLVSTNAIVSGVTTTRQLDLSSADTPEGAAVSHFAVEAQSNSQGIVVLATLDNTEYSGFEFTVQAREGANLFQITKLVGVSDDGPGANIFFAEYANVFNTRPLGSFNVISATNDTQLVVNATTANQVDYVVNVIAYKRSTP